VEFSKEYNQSHFAVLTSLTVIIHLLLLLDKVTTIMAYYNLTIKVRYTQNSDFLNIMFYTVALN